MPQEQGYTVVAFLADVGQEEDWSQVRSKAEKLGASKMEIVDLRKEFVETMLFPAIQCNAQVSRCGKPDDCSREANDGGADSTKVAIYLALSGGKISCLAPWRDPEFFQRFQGRNDLLAYAKKMGIPVTQTTAKPYSMDDNLAHCSYESGQLEDPSRPPPNDMWTRTDDPMTAPSTPQFVTIQFEKGIPVKVSSEGKEYTESLELFIALNAIGKTHGIGRIDIVENRSLGGLKSRGCYDSPAMTILRLAHLDLEGLVLDGRVRSLRDQGYTFRPNGEVKLRLYRGNCDVFGRSSETENLYSEEQSSMDSLVDFSPVDTTGFININAIRLKKYGLQNLEESKSRGEL
ncbi:MAG: hypothetical protein Q9167_001093 [Letrouitia subvulpina]